MTSKFHNNLTEAARAADMLPTRLHEIEGAEVAPEPDEVIALLRIYNTVPPVTCACGRDLRAGEAFKGSIDGKR